MQLNVSFDGKRRMMVIWPTEAGGNCAEQPCSITLLPRGLRDYEYVVLLGATSEDHPAMATTYQLEPHPHSIERMIRSWLTQALQDTAFVQQTEELEELVALYTLHCLGAIWHYLAANCARPYHDWVLRGSLIDH